MQLAIAPLLLLVALAGPAPARDADAGEAQRLYTLGERAMGEGQPTRAVPLWRQAIVALPQTSAYDRLRHRLVLRLGYGLMAAWERSGDRRYLLDAQRLLERYVERHEAIFGDDARARAERGEAYEQLYEVERRATPPAANDDDGTAAASTTKDERGPDARGLKRVVRVKTRRWHPPTHDDARVHEWIAGPQTSVETGLVMTAPTLQPLDPPRAYVRLAGPVGGGDDRSGGDDRGRGRRSLARAALLAARPALRACFSDAFARSPHDVVRTAVRLDLGDDGRIRAADVVGEDVIDAAGSACVEQQLASVALDAGDHGQDTLELPLVFFWKDARMLDEANGAIVRDHWDSWQRPRELNHGAMGFLPPVDEFKGH